MENDNTFTIILLVIIAWFVYSNHKDTQNITLQLTEISAQTKQINLHLDSLDSQIHRITNHRVLSIQGVTGTIYYPVRGQTDDTPTILADGSSFNPDHASHYRYIALSRDLLSRWGGPFHYNDIILVSGAGKYNGLWIVKDTMNKRFHKRVDFLTSVGTPLFKSSSLHIQLIKPSQFLAYK